MRPVTLPLAFQQPYDAAAMLAFLRRRALAGIELINGDTYARTLRLAHGPAVMRLRVGPCSIDGDLWVAHPADLDRCVRHARDLLDLDADPSVVDRHLAGFPTLAASVADHPGLRVPGHVDGFEVAVRAIVGQQISVAGATTILSRLAETYGEMLVTAPYGLTHLFPSAEALATADPADLPMPRSRGRALVTVAQAVAEGRVALDRGADRQEVRRELLALAGIGPWTASYIALRAFGDPDIFLATDLGIRQGLASMGVLDMSAADTEAWSPWRSYAMMHVWQALASPAP